MQRAVVTRVVTIGALALAAILVVVLAVQKRILEARVLDLSGRLRDPYPGFLVPPTPATTLNGDSVAVGAMPADRLQLLLVFTTTCQACTASVPAWMDLHANLMARDVDVEVLGLVVDSTDAAQAYVAQHQLPFPAVRFTDARTRALYRIRRVPQVLLVDPMGRVRYVRAGALTDEAAADSVRAAVRDAEAQMRAQRAAVAARDSLAARAAP